MLTGDKEETAINIGVACNLLLPGDHMETVVVNGAAAPTRGGLLALLHAATQVTPYLAPI